MGAILLILGAGIVTTTAAVRTASAACVNNNEVAVFAATQGSDNEPAGLDARSDITQARVAWSADCGTMTVGLAVAQPTDPNTDPNWCNSPTGAAWYVQPSSPSGGSPMNFTIVFNRFGPLA